MRAAPHLSLLGFVGLLLIAAQPAAAAGVGFSLPKFRMLGVGANTSYGGSVQVIGTELGIGRLRLDLALDYAYTRNFKAGANYAFFDVGVGLGLPLGITQNFYLTPALYSHGLFFVASPEALDAPALGLAPRLTAGFKPAANIAVELGLSYGLVFGLKAKNQTFSGSMAIVELGGSYSF